MMTTTTVEQCLARACRLTRLADEASDYETMLTYDGLALEWLELASRQARKPTAGSAPAASAVVVEPVKPVPSRRRWFWFR